MAVLNLPIVERYFMLRGMWFQIRAPCDLKELSPISVRDGGTVRSLAAVLPEVLV